MISSRQDYEARDWKNFGETRDLMGAMLQKESEDEEGVVKQSEGLYSCMKEAVKFTGASGSRGCCLCLFYWCSWELRHPLSHWVETVETTTATAEATVTVTMLTMREAEKMSFSFLLPALHDSCLLGCWPESLFLGIYKTFAGFSPLAIQRKLLNSRIESERQKTINQKITA